MKGKGTFEKVEPVWRQLIDGYGIQLKIEGLIAEGNTVAVRYLESGTFRRPAFGNQPTGRSYELVAMEWFEIESGRIKRRWGARDAATQARQLGIAPAYWSLTARAATKRNCRCKISLICAKDSEGRANRHGELISGKKCRRYCRFRPPRSTTLCR